MSSNVRLETASISPGNVTTKLTVLMVAMKSTAKCTLAELLISDAHPVHVYLRRGNATIQSTVLTLQMNTLNAVSTNR